MVFFAVGLFFSISNFFVADSYRILAVLPFPSKSHYAVIDPLMVKLADLGHHVTIYDPFPKKKIIPNYEEHDISSCSASHLGVKGTIDNMASMGNNKILFILKFPTFSPAKVEDITECPPLYKLLNSTEKYDLFITESFNSDHMLLFANKFQIPFITFMPNVLLPWLGERMQTPLNPSYVPTPLTGFLSKMTFLQRVENALIYWMFSITYNYRILNKCDEVNKRLLGPSSPSLYDTVKKTSILFSSSHNSLNPITPLVPGVVEIAGIHIKPAAPLPTNIEKFINESEHGVVYFCMGSFLTGETFPEEKRNAFLYAFSKIPQRVLWKWEGEVLPGKSNNVMISKWMPQRDILAHPNVKLFISHGGHLGSSEAVYEGVPILGIPIFGDQKTNVKSIEANGAGEQLNYDEISKEVVLEKIQRLLNNPKYKENAKQLSERYKDRPMPPLETAVYWTEYVIRHKGAPHLKSAAMELTWFQYLLLDVIAFILVVIISVLLIIYYTCRFILKSIKNCIFGKFSPPKPPKKQKKN